MAGERLPAKFLFIARYIHGGKESAYEIRNKPCANQYTK